MLLRMCQNAAQTMKNIYPKNINQKFVKVNIN